MSECHQMMGVCNTISKQHADFNSVGRNKPVRACLELVEARQQELAFPATQYPASRKRYLALHP
jgi:hypothetical protein